LWWAIEFCLKVFAMEIDSTELDVAFIERRLLFIARATPDMILVLLIRVDRSLRCSRIEMLGTWCRPL
jgi:hypothetical protein